MRLPNGLNKKPETLYILLLIYITFQICRSINTSYTMGVFRCLCLQKRLFNTHKKKCVYGTDASSYSLRQQISFFLGFRMVKMYTTEGLWVLCGWSCHKDGVLSVRDVFFFFCVAKIISFLRHDHWSSSKQTWFLVGYGAILLLAEIRTPGQNPCVVVWITWYI